MKKALITVITAVLNDGDGLQRTFESVLEQKFTQVEYVVVDGASTDNTLDIISRYEREFMACGIRLSWMSEKDSGIYEAFNKGIDMAQGRYFIFMGAGDYFFPNTFDTLYNTLESGEYDFVYGNVYHESDQVILKLPENAREIIIENICQQAIFYKADVFTKLGHFDLKYPILSDYHFNLKCFSPKNGLKIYCTQQMIAVYKGWGVSEQKIDEVFRKDFQDMVIENFGQEMLSHYEIKSSERLIRLSQNFVSARLQKKIISSDDRFIIYGAAEWGQRFYNALQEQKLRVIAFSDSDPDKWHKKFNDHEIIPPREIQNSDFTKILVASSKRIEIRDTLMQMGYKEEDILYLRMI